jgi:hypothetical protein
LKSMVYFGYRYYCSSMGRWTGREPLGERANENLAGFVRNNPVAAVDFLGLALLQTGCPQDDRTNPWLAFYRQKMSRWGCSCRVECYTCRDDIQSGDTHIEGESIFQKYPKTGTCVARVNLGGVSFVDTLTHELTHCLQKCMENNKKGCAGTLCREIEAYHRGQPYLGNNALRTGAHRSASWASACDELSPEAEKAIMTDAFVDSCKETGYPP